MTKWLSLLVGGAAGTAARYGLAALIYHKLGGAFPFGTLAVNMLGCFIIGFLAALLGRKLEWPPEMSVFLITGFCSAFTTFSAFIMESDVLIKEGRVPAAALYLGLSVATGYLIFRLGLRLGENF